MYNVVAYRPVARQRPQNKQRDIGCCYATIVRWAVIIRPVSGQRLGKHVPAATVTHALGRNEMLSTQSEPGT
jgi:hypothetical protein